MADKRKKRQNISGNDSKQSESLPDSDLQAFSESEEWVPGLLRAIPVPRFLGAFKGGPAGLRIVLALVLAGSIWLAYSHCLNADFQLDDQLHIVNNPDVHMQDFSWERLLIPAQLGKSRPVVTSSLKLSYYFSWLEPCGYRLFNVMVHIMAAILFFLVLVPAFRRTRYGPGEKDPGIQRFFIVTAFVAAAAWALSPLSTAGVTYIIQRAVTMSAMFSLGALGCYILGRSASASKRWLWYTIGFFLWLLAVGSKPPAVLLPFGILLYEIYFFRNGRLFQDPGRNRLAWRLFLGLVAAGVVLVLWQGEFLLSVLGKGYDRYDFNMYQRLLSFPRIMFYYLSLVFLPLPERIAVDPSFVAHSADWLTPWTTIPSWIGLGVLLYGAWFLRHREKLISFGICWFILFLLIEQTFIPLQLVFHHRLYMPQMFIIAGVIFWAARQAKALNLNATGLVAGTVMVTMLGFGAYHRNDLWNQPYRIWEAEYNLDPESSRIMINLSREYLKTGRSQKAITLLYRLLDQDPKDLRAYINIANAFSILGKHERAIFYLEQGVREVPRWPQDEAFKYLMLMAKSHMALQRLEKAEKFYRKALEIAGQGKRPAVYLQLARLYHSMEKIQKAIEMAQKAVLQRDKYYEGYFYLGSLYAVSGEEEKARQAFKNAVGGEPAINSKAYKHLANLSEWEDELEHALGLYKKALEFNPEDAGVRINIGTILARQGQLEKAAAFFREALQEANMQQTFRAYYNLGKVAIEKGDAQVAMHNLQRAYHLNSKDAGTLYALGNLYLDIGRKEKGRQLLSDLLRMKPDHPKADFIQKRINETGDNH